MADVVPGDRHRSRILVDDRVTLHIPWWYETEYVTLAEAQRRLLEHHHPEYVRRLIAWLAHKGGSIGVGSTFRPDGTQPDEPGFAPEGRSFHQNQRYSDGFIGACAVDLVAANGNEKHRTVKWSEVIPQFTAEARRWGLHCNVGAPPSGEPWHMQPIEIDGWVSWTNAGSPAPRPNYPLPTTEGDDMTDDQRIACKGNWNGSWWRGNGRTRKHTGGAAAKVALAHGLVDAITGKILASWNDASRVDQSQADQLVGRWDGTTSEA